MQFRTMNAALCRALATLFASVHSGTLTAQSGTTMTPAAPTGSAPQKRGMTNTMGAPGLVPYGIMIGTAGKWMVGYRYMLERLRGLTDGSTPISEADVLARFQTTPTNMLMQMHMAMMMYAPTDRFTVTAILPYISMSMGELHRDGTRSTERSSGVGDLELRGLYALSAAKGLHHRLLANLGIGLPTGSVNQPDAEGLRLEYPMQSGSGTFSLLPGLTYLGQALPWGWGATLNSTVRLGTNEHGYRLGNRTNPKSGSRES